MARLRLPSLPPLPPLRLPRGSALRSLPALRPSLQPQSLPKLPRLPRLPLPVTTTAVLVLVLVPALILSRWSRPRAAGLEQVMGVASLLQSFPASPDRPVPQLWRERLGPDLARLLWTRQRTVWWQLWASHGEAAPYLVLPSQALGGPSAALPPQALRVGDLIVMAESTIARQQLRTSLRPLQRRSQGLLQHCHQRLQEPQGVFWQADALGTLLGPVAPLLERYQVGCLTLALEGNGLRWQGEAGPTTLLAVGSGAPAAQSPTPQVSRSSAVAAYAPPRPPLGSNQLLELEGSSLDQLLAGLLSRQMIRDPLAARYGLEGDRLDRLRRAPFRLLLLPQAKGPFQATLELFIPVGSERALWTGVLEKVRASLLEQGLSPSDPALAGAPGAEPTLQPGEPAPTSSTAAPAPASKPATEGAPPTGAAPSTGATPSTGGTPPTPGAPGGRTASTPSEGSASASGPQAATKGTSLWWRSDGSLVGGWRWLDQPGQEPQLLLFLGPPPPAGPERAGLAAGSSAAARLPSPLARRTTDGVERLRFSARPAALQSLGLLSGTLPGLVRQADQLWLSSETPRPTGPVRSLARGSLTPSSPGSQAAGSVGGEAAGISLLSGRLQLAR